MCYIKAIQSRTWRLHLQQFFKDLDSEKPRICVVSHFRNLENTQKKIVTHRLHQMQYYANFLIFLCTVEAEWNVRMLFCVVHHEEMRIFKVRKRSEKSRRYVITRIYGFFVFSEICTFVQCGVRRNNIRRIFCRCVLKFTCEKTVRQLFYHAKFSKNKIRRCSMGLLWKCSKARINPQPQIYIIIPVR